MDSPFNKNVELVSAGSLMYGIDSLRIVDIYREVLDFDGRMLRKSREGGQVPQGCIRFGIAAEI